MKIIVIGAGIGGLTAAIALGRLGIDADIYERASELREVGAGIALAVNALRALDLLGLGGGIRAMASGGVQGGLRTPAGEYVMEIPTDEMTKEIGALAVVHRAELLERLVTQIDPEHLHLGMEFTGYDQNANGVTARFRDGETARADALIGADGLRSAVRTELLGNRMIRYAGYTAWRAVVDFDRGDSFGIAETWGRGQRFGIVPMSRNRIYWFATNNAPEGEREPQGRTKEVLRGLFHGWHDPIEALIAAAGEGDILRNDIYDMDPLSRWGEGRVVLLGDAAHPMTPNLGQGACQAIEDAVVLSWCLKAQPNVDTALRTYQLRRIPRTRKLVLRSRWFGAVAQLENRLLCQIRNSVLHPTPTRAAARQMKSLLDFEVLTADERSLYEQTGGAS